MPVSIKDSAFVVTDARAISLASKISYRDGGFIEPTLPPSF